jgi:hypothetical protein
VDDDESFANLVEAVVAIVPASRSFHNVQSNSVTIVQASPAYDSVHWIVEVEGGVVDHVYPLPDYFGVRDTANGYTYVEYETGEVELYDLNADPLQLENKADDPSYEAVRDGLEQSLAERIGSE